MSALFRVYTGDELGQDGYPPVWHLTLKHAVREAAGHRCVRCGHPYRRGEHPLVRELDDEGCEVFVSWSPCDEHCTHGGPLRIVDGMPLKLEIVTVNLDGDISTASVNLDGLGMRIEARWRILTVHHLDMDKANCRWWNLVALCQRCHLDIQWKVKMPRRWLHEHSDWFKPYVAGYYAFVYLGEELTREEVTAGLDELLSLEHRQLAIGDRT